MAELLKRSIIFILFLPTILCGDFQFTQWTTYPKPLLTNFLNMYQPCVIKIDDPEYPYRMWFFGWATTHGNEGVPGCDAIYVARSKDIFQWEVLSKDGTWDTSMSPEKWKAILWADNEVFDEWHNGDPSVVYKDGVYYMAFSTTSKPLPKKLKGYPSEMMLYIRGAVSIDGIHWKKTPKPLISGKYEIPSNPNYIRPTKDAPERIGDFHRPCLRWEDGKWKLWFDYWNGRKLNQYGDGLHIAYAENTGDFFDPDGFVIKSNYIEKPELDNFPNPDVIKIGATYYMYGDPQGFGNYDRTTFAGVWKSRQLREAVSSDGLNWTLNDWIPRPTEADIYHVPQTLVINMGDYLRQFLFFAIQRGGPDDAFDYQYKSINVMWRDIYEKNK